MLGYLFLTPLGALINVIFAQAQDAIAILAKPSIFALVAAFYQRQRVPVNAVTFDGKLRTGNNEVTNKRSHWLLRLIRNAHFAEPPLNNQFDFGTFVALVMCRPCPVTLTRTESRPVRVGRLGFIAIAAPLAYKMCGAFVQRMLFAINRPFPDIRTLLGAKSPLCRATAGPYPELLATDFAVLVNTILRSYGNSRPRLVITWFRAIARAAICGGRHGNTKRLAANLARSINLLFKRLTHALLRAIEFVFVFLATYGANGHGVLKWQAPGCAMSLSRRRGFRGPEIDYMQFA